MSNNNEFIAVARKRHAFLCAQRDRIEVQREAFIDDMKRLEVLLERNTREMASYLLAEVGDQELMDLQERLRYPGLIPIKRKFEAELARVQRQIAVESENPDVEHGEFHLSRVEDEIAEIKEAHAHVSAQLERWHGSLWFEELNERRYFAPDYEPGLLDRFWDWRAVSFLMEHLEDAWEMEFDSPDELKLAYQQLRNEATPIINLFRNLQARRKGLIETQAFYKALLERPDQLFPEMYDALAEAIFDHFESCPMELKIELAGKDKHLSTFLKKSAGLGKQIEYLNQLRVARIAPLKQSLDVEIAKLERKIQKARYKPKYHSAATLDGMRNLKQHKWQKRHAKLYKIRSRITSFKSYKSGAFTDDYLWWDAITRGAPADDIYEVKVFRREHPDWDWRNHTPAHERHSAMDHAAVELTQRMAPVGAQDDWDLDVS